MNWNTPESRFTVGFVTAAFVCMVVIILAVKGDLQPVWSWLHKWQALIAGSMAVIAAFLSVREARRQYMLSRWVEHAKMAEDFKLMQGLRLKIDGMLDRADPCLNYLHGQPARTSLRSDQIERLDLELESNIRKAFNPLFFDSYVNLSKKLVEFNQRVKRQASRNGLSVGAVIDEYSTIVQELWALHRSAEITERVGQAFIARINRYYPADMRFSLALVRADWN